MNKGISALPLTLGVGEELRDSAASICIEKPQMPIVAMWPVRGRYGKNPRFVGASNRLHYVRIVDALAYRLPPHSRDYAVARRFGERSLLVSHQYPAQITRCEIDPHF